MGGVGILMHRPTVPTSFFKFLSVLETRVWLCILATYLVTSLLLWTYDRWSPQSYRNNSEKYKEQQDHDSEKRIFTLRESLWFCITSLTPQGGGAAPKNLSGRIVTAAWWLFGFIIIASYTTNLAALLTVSRLEKPIDSLDDLSKQYKVLYAPTKDSTAMLYFKRMAYIEELFYEKWKDLALNDTLSPTERTNLAVWEYPLSDKYTKIWQAMQEAKLPSTLEEAVASARNSTPSAGFAYIGDASDIRYLVKTNCDLVKVGQEFSRKPYAMALQKNSHLKQSFDEAIFSMLAKRRITTK